MAKTSASEFQQQYAALTRGVGFAPLAGRTIIQVTGSERVQFLQSFTTNDVKRLQPGQGCEAFVTSSQGKTLGHVWIFCESKRHILDTTAGQAQTLIGHFDRYVISEDVTFADKSDHYVDLLVVGAGAAAMLAKLTTQDAPHNLLDHGEFKIAGRQVTICRVDYAGPDCYFIQAANGDSQAVAEAIAEAGGVAYGHDVLESARLETGFPLFGLDITSENLPQEINRDRQAISFTKGCYLGQETVARIDAMGHVNRLLVGVQFKGDEIPARDTELLAAGQKIGETTSVAWSPRLQAPLALAVVRRNNAKPGNELETKYGQAVVVALPLAAVA
jgi:folate-binding protein YgfZ